MHSLHKSNKILLTSCRHLPDIPLFTPLHIAYTPTQRVYIFSHNLNFKTINNQKIDSYSTDFFYICRNKLSKLT